MIGALMKIANKIIRIILKIWVFFMEIKQGALIRTCVKIKIQNLIMLVENVTNMSA
jgi:hypothetical protein